MRGDGLGPREVGWTGPSRGPATQSMNHCITSRYGPMVLRSYGPSVPSLFFFLCSFSTYRFISVLDRFSLNLTFDIFFSSEALLTILLILRLLSYRVFRPSRVWRH